MVIETDCDHDLVPEWRYKYVDYNAGKRHIKAISRAVHDLNSTARPMIRVGNFKRSETHKRLSGGVASPTNGRMPMYPNGDFHDRKQATKVSNTLNELTEVKSTVETTCNSDLPSTYLSKTNTYPVKDESEISTYPVKDAGKTNSKFGNMLSPVKDESKISSKFGNTLSPLDATSNFTEKYYQQEKVTSIDQASRDFTSKTISDNLSSEQRKDTSKDSRNDGQRKLNGESLNSIIRRVGSPSTINSGIASPTPKDADKFHKLKQKTPFRAMSFLSNVFINEIPISSNDSHQSNIGNVGNIGNIGITAPELVRLRQDDFVKWFEQEVEKVDLFYKTKEDEADVLLEKLRVQLLEMRNRRVEELEEAKHRQGSVALPVGGINNTANSSNKQEITGLTSDDWLKQPHVLAKKLALDIWSRISSSFIGENTKALKMMQANPGFDAPRILIDQENPNMMEKGDDHAQRSQYADQVPYRKAKRKLKLALFECFRGIKLLKSYTVLNQLAFRKLVRKYNQAAGTHAPIINLSGKVSQAWFVKSDVLDSQLSSAVSLYARYFECGNQTIALVKLRNSIAPRTDESPMTFRNGVFMGTGIFFCFQALLKASNILTSSDQIIRLQTISLLEIYAGYFLCLYLLALFYFDCYIWTRNHINYQFVIEFDIGHTLDLGILASIPTFFLSFLGLCMWINFSISEYSKIYMYIPIILIATTGFLIFLPAPVLFHRGRRWFIYSNLIFGQWRLLLSGLYPVEFRDFFLADIYSSLTYVMAWRDPLKCGSSQSRLLGFFTTIPTIWRMLQCFRRYYDTREKFPHLLNCVKYVTTILYLTSLSMYRISGTYRAEVLFIIAAVINSSFSSTWDVLMDWSLLQPNSKDIFLRDVRGYRNSWWYYSAMILNPIMRFFWILYTANFHVLGHSSKISFFIAFVEATRRGIWAIFRVENAHCSNVAHFKANLDLQLPYKTPIGPEKSVTDANFGENNGQIKTSSVSPALGPRRSLEFTMQRRPLSRILSDAHTKDFEKRHGWRTGQNSCRAPGKKSNNIDSEGETSSDND